MTNQINNRLQGLNESQKRAIRSAASNMSDNLYRAKMQKRAMPEWKSGNGETIDEVIAQYQEEYDALMEGLA